MKIGLVSPYDFAYPSGVVNHILALNREFTKRGHEVKIIAPASKFPTTLPQNLITIGKPRPVPASGSIVRITLSARISQKIEEILEDEKFDIVHLHEPFMPMLCTSMLRLSKGPNIGTFHACRGNPGYDFGRPFTTFLIRRRSKKLASRIAVSRAAANYAEKYIPGHYEIIPNGIDLEHFSPHTTPIEEFCDGKINILFVGRLEKRKGLSYLLEAYQTIKSKYPDTRLIIVGPGKRLRHQYERFVSDNKLKDVEFIGYVPYEHLPSYYKTADIFCSPAIGWESFGIVLLEAMALGKPVVASNIDGYREVIETDQQGILVPPKDTEALSKALITLIDEPELRAKMGTINLTMVGKYSWEEIANKILDLYANVLSGPPWLKSFPINTETALKK